jgi:TatD DNase family protein
VQVSDFEAVRALAHAGAVSYALGIHPLRVRLAEDDDLAQLDAVLTQHASDPRLVAVGEIGLDFFDPDLRGSPWRERQTYFYQEQLKLAQRHGLPVILHSRRSVDQVLHGLRRVAGAGGRWHGIAHAFNGSLQQAQALIDLGLKLGFGGAVTYERAQQLRRLAVSLPLEAMVLETDAPDMPPHWLYTTAEQRAAGQPQGINTPAELPRIGAVVAALRGIAVEELADATTHNAMAALARLRQLLALHPPGNSFPTDTQAPWHSQTPQT